MWDKHLESSFLWTASVMEQMARGPPTPCPMLLFCPGILSSLGGAGGGPGSSLLVLQHRSLAAQPCLQTGTAAPGPWQQCSWEKPPARV